MEADTKTVTEKEVTERARLMADADKRSGEKEDPKKIRVPLIVKLSRSYDDLSGNKNKIDTVDLSGLETLTTMDAQEVDQIVSRMGHVPGNKWKDTLYTKHAAVKASGLPVEFFNQLLWKDMEEIKATVAYYFLFD